jgi:hypothetical protein
MIAPFSYVFVVSYIDIDDFYTIYCTPHSDISVPYVFFIVPCVIYSIPRSDTDIPRNYIGYPRTILIISISREL